MNQSTKTLLCGSLNYVNLTFRCELKHFKLKIELDKLRPSVRDMVLDVCFNIRFHLDVNMVLSCCLSSDVRTAKDSLQTANSFLQINNY